MEKVKQKIDDIVQDIVNKCKQLGCEIIIDETSIGNHVAFLGGRVIDSTPKAKDEFLKDIKREKYSFYRGDKKSPSFPWWLENLLDCKNQIDKGEIEKAIIEIMDLMKDYKDIIRKINQVAGRQKAQKRTNELKAKNMAKQDPEIKKYMAKLLSNGLTHVKAKELASKKFKVSQSQIQKKFPKKSFKQEK